MPAKSFGLSLKDLVDKIYSLTWCILARSLTRYFPNTHKHDYCIIGAYFVNKSILISTAY